MLRRPGLVLWFAVWGLLWVALIASVVSGTSRGELAALLVMYFAALPLSPLVELLPQSLQRLTNSVWAGAAGMTGLSYLFWFVVMPFVLRLFRAVQPSHEHPKES